MSHYKQIRMLVTLTCLTLATQIVPITLKIIPIALHNDQYKVLLQKDPATEIWKLLQTDIKPSTDATFAYYSRLGAFFAYKAALFLEYSTNSTWQEGTQDFLDSNLTRGKFNLADVKNPSSFDWASLWKNNPIWRILAHQTVVDLNAPFSVLRITYKTIPRNEDAFAWFDVSQEGDISSRFTDLPPAQFLRWFKTIWNGAYDSPVGIGYQLNQLYGLDLTYYAARLAVAARKIHDTWFELKNILIIDETFAGLDKQPMTIENVQYKSVWDVFNRHDDRFYGFKEPFERHLKPLLTDMIYQEGNIQGALQATQNKILLFKGDDSMGIGKGGSGQNEVGILLMQIRDGLNGAGLAEKKDYSLKTLLEAQRKNSNVFVRNWYKLTSSIRRWWYSK